MRERHPERLLDVCMTVQLILCALAVLLHVQELASLQTEAISAVEARNVAHIGFHDLSGVSIGALMGMMECKLSQVQISAEFCCLRQDERD